MTLRGMIVGIVVAGSHRTRRLLQLEANVLVDPLGTLQLEVANTSESSDPHLASPASPGGPALQVGFQMPTSGEKWARDCALMQPESRGTGTPASSCAHTAAASAPCDHDGSRLPGR